MKNLSDGLKIYSTNGNIIRVICALAVIVHHSYYLSANDFDPLYYLTNGQLGIGGVSVCVFFFYSGLYVSKSLRQSSSSLNFLFKRCKRIFPQLWIVILLSVLLLGPIFTSLTLSEYFTNSQTYTYLLNCILLPIHNLPGVFESNIYGPAVNGALWTLPVEFACYIALALILVITSKLFKNKDKTFKVLDILGLTVSLLCMIACIYINNNFLVSFFRCLTIFFVGAIYYDYADKISLSWKLALPSFVLLVISFFTPLLNILIMIFLPYFLCYISVGIKQVKTKNKLFTMSYEMYLIGFPIQQALVAMFGGSMPVWLNSVIAIVIVVVLMLIVVLTKTLISMKTK